MLALSNSALRLTQPNMTKGRQDLWQKRGKDDQSAVVQQTLDYSRHLLAPPLPSQAFPDLLQQLRIFVVRLSLAYICINNQFILFLDQREITQDVFNFIYKKEI